MKILLYPLRIISEDIEFRMPHLLFHPSNGFPVIFHRTSMLIPDAALVIFSFPHMDSHRFACFYFLFDAKILFIRKRQKRETGFYFISYTCTYCQFVNHLRFNQGRIHIKTDETPHPAIHVIQLKRKIHFQIGSQLHQLFLHGNPVFGSAADRKFNACPCARSAFVQRNTSCQTLDSIDIHSLLCKNTSNCRNLASRQFASQ